MFDFVLFLFILRWTTSTGYDQFTCAAMLTITCPEEFALNSIVTYHGYTSSSSTCTPAPSDCLEVGQINECLSHSSCNIANDHRLISLCLLQSNYIRATFTCIPVVSPCATQYAFPSGSEAVFLARRQDKNCQSTLVTAESSIFHFFNRAASMEPMQYCESDYLVIQDSKPDMNISIWNRWCAHNDQSGTLLTPFFISSSNIIGINGQLSASDIYIQTRDRAYRVSPVVKTSEEVAATTTKSTTTTKMTTVEVSSSVQAIATESTVTKAQDPVILAQTLAQNRYNGLGPGPVVGIAIGTAAGIAMVSVAAIFIYRKLCRDGPISSLNSSNSNILLTSGSPWLPWPVSTSGQYPSAGQQQWSSYQNGTVPHQLPVQAFTQPAKPYHQGPIPAAPPPTLRHYPGGTLRLQSGGTLRLSSFLQVPLNVMPSNSFPNMAGNNQVPVHYPQPQPPPPPLLHHHQNGSFSQMPRININQPLYEQGYAGHPTFAVPTDFNPSAFSRFRFEDYVSGNRAGLRSVQGNASRPTHSPTPIVEFPPDSDDESRGPANPIYETIR